ncbi:amidohydrolase family protein [Acuticoccus sediminis]|uniref:amidohydrolase family protein n=1 Tax=Acuticoccus sediminis TaxID=2184697 RepID=UPI001CFCC4AB|nr:amidohydrolase family protein [Acuticoccus sediminis]
MGEPDLTALPDRLIDAHMHLWDLSLGKHPWLCGEMIPFRYGDYSSIRRDYLAPDYRADAGPMNVVATVYVEAEWDPADPFGETRWVHNYAAEAGFPNAVVAQAFMDAENAGEVIAKQATFPLVRSVRHKPAAARAPAEAQRGAAGSMDDPRWRDGYAHLARHGLGFDLQTPWWHLDAAAELARDFPQTRIILNHTGLPADRSPEGLAGWRAAMETLAREPNVAVKISGIGLRGERWSLEKNVSVVRDAIAIFGPERAMFASNFPVDSVVGEMTAIFAGFAAVTSDLAPDVRRALFHDNAARFYRIAPRATAKTQEKVLGGTR